MTMTETELVQAILAWVVEHVPEVDGSTYDYMPAGKAKGLPDVAAEIVSTEIAQRDPDFPLGDIQQVALKIRRLGLSFMVASGVDEAGSRAATLELRTFVDRLSGALIDDHTLGGRVQLASPYLIVDYQPAFVEYADGTRGRQMTAQLAVAELLSPED